MKSILRPALTLFVLLTLLTGVGYPALVTLIAQGVFPSKANGSLIKNGDKIAGSELIGQSFDEPRYFWGRPSATDPVPYNAAASNASNRGPTNPDLLKEVGERVKAMRDAQQALRNVQPEKAKQPQKDATKAMKDVRNELDKLIAEAEKQKQDPLTAAKNSVLVLPESLRASYHETATRPLLWSTATLG